MKNLKKSLALVLVLVLALGMVPFAAASSSAALMNVDDFIDENDIQYREAADVLAAIGVYQGEGAVGSRAFRPSDTITRAEAAAIMARVTLGTDTAQALALATTPFSDVPESHWASGYIMFGVDRGYLAATGYGDGTFRPNESVTAVQMAKMLLGAIGYGVNGEFEGNAWDLRVVDRAMNRDVRVLWYTGDPDFSRPATREEVAQYTFNALTETRMVSWNSTINDYSSWGNIVNLTDARPSLGRFTFGLVAEADSDGYGIAGRYWRYAGGRILTGYWQTHQILSVTVNGTPIDTLNNTSSSLTVRGRSGFVAEIGRRWVEAVVGPTGTVLTAAGWVDWTLADIPVYVNGIQIEEGFGTSTSISRSDAFRLAATAGVTVILTDAPEFDGMVDSIVIIAPTAKEAAGPPIISTSGNVTIPGVTEGTLQYRGAGTNTNITYDAGILFTTPGGDEALHQAAIDVRSDLIEYPAGIESGDMLLVHQKWVEGSKVIVVEKADVIEGQMTSVRTAAPSNITFSGQTLSQSLLTPWVLFNDNTAAPNTFVMPEFLDLQTRRFADHDRGNLQENFNADAIMWLDHAGRVIRAKLVEGGAFVYGLVLEYGGDGGELQPGRQVRLATSDGTVGYCNIALRPGQNNTHLDFALQNAMTHVGRRVPAFATDTALTGAPRATDTSLYHPIIVRYNLINDNTVSIFTGATHVEGTGTTRDTTTGYTVRRTANPNLAGAPNRRMAAHTTVFYFQWASPTSGAGSEFLDAMIPYDAITNPLYVGIGPEAASEIVGADTRTVYVPTTVPDTSLNLEALAFNTGNVNTGNRRYIFLSRTTPIGSSADDPRGIVSIFESFTDGVLTSPAVQTRPDGGNPFNTGAGTNLTGRIGLYSYLPTGAAGALGGVRDEGPLRPSQPGSTPEGSSQIVFADAQTIRTQGLASGNPFDALVDNTGAGGAVVRNYDEIRVGANTKYFMYEHSTVSLTPMTANEFFLRITNNTSGVQYHLLGVQPDASPTVNPEAVAVYFEYVPMTAGTQQALAIEAISNAAGAANTISIQQLNTASGTTNAVAELLDGYRAAIQAGTPGTLNSAADIGAMIDAVNKSFANALADLIAIGPWEQFNDDEFTLKEIEIDTTDSTITDIASGNLPAFTVSITNVQVTTAAPANFAAVTTMPTIPPIAAGPGSATQVIFADDTVAIATGSPTAGTSIFSVTFTVSAAGATSDAKTITGITFTQI